MLRLSNKNAGIPINSGIYRCSAPKMKQLRKYKKGKQEKVLSVYVYKYTDKLFSVASRSFTVDFFENLAEIIIIGEAYFRRYLRHGKLGCF